jgi:RNA polymerase sigma-70 factor, ECF subfamily
VVPGESTNSSRPVVTLDSRRREHGLLADQANLVDVALLVTQAKDGSAEAFDRLMELHAPGVYNLALRVTRSREVAEDCVQEAFVRAYRGLPRFRGDAAFSTWLYQVALNVAREAVKKLGRDPLLVSDLTAGDAGTPSDLDDVQWRTAPAASSPEEAVIAGQRRRVVLQAVESLPAHHRDVILLYDLQGLSYEEIARVLQIRVGTVKSRLNRARLALKEALSGHMELLRG